MPNKVTEQQSVVLRARIVAFLEASDGPQPARKIARAVGASKPEVNSALYGESARFERQGADPPLWTLSSPRVKPEDEIALSSPLPSESAPSQDLRSNPNGGHPDFIDEKDVAGEWELSGLHILACYSLASPNDPYVDFDIVEDGRMVVTINTNHRTFKSWKDGTSKDDHVLHCVADCLSLRRMEALAHCADRADLFSLKGQVLASLRASRVR